MPYEVAVTVKPEAVLYPPAPPPPPQAVPPAAPPAITKYSTVLLSDDPVPTELTVKVPLPVKV